MRASLINNIRVQRVRAKLQSRAANLSTLTEDYEVLRINQSIMSDIHTPAVEREPPSLPASPDPKRVKHIEPAANLSVACTPCIIQHLLCISKVNRFTDQTFKAILNDDSVTPTPSSPPQVHQNGNGTMTSQAANVTLPSMSLEPPPPALQIKLLSEKAQAPTRGSAFAAGYDLYSAQDTMIPARGKAIVDTDISIAVPIDTCTT